MYGWRGRIGLMVPRGNSVMEPEFNRLGVLAFGCTSGSFVGGKGYDEKLIRIMEQEAGIPATATTTAILRARG